ncbi:Short-chain dehydrogenase [Candidatus Rhodobacter oscarellae]|uniref:Short-chain dehydrogenase n=1 Tax=Candidatus Rhodobacter oscarellae TaxID=1675527 RepID=A0A0J9EDM0_9RHOB|nr:SDR family NAD(P)-dependent oxidoreductase [Candidatus Rhodobacter lobularis]KMW59829.1 Short-chain dehydrogenase [Candidatus Rhodobacter lobularis]
MSVALIVGCGDHIGAAIAKRFAAGGFTVCCARRRNEDKLGALVAEIEAAGGAAHGFTMDARDEAAVAERFQWIEEEVGPLDLVVCNTGGNVRFPIRETTSRVFTKVWEMACFAGFLSGREAARYMVPRGRGAIFFTGATASVRGGSGYAAFAAAKSGQRALAEAMARELGPQGIHVAHLVVDAGVDTAFVRELFAAQGKPVEDGALMDPARIAEAYWHLYHQPRDGWTFEMDIRPHGENW